MNIPFLEGYWEAWNMTKPNDYASDLSKIPVSSIPVKGAANVVSIAFGDYSYSRDSSNSILIGYLNQQVMKNGQIFGAKELRSAVNCLKLNGGKVKLSVGGATFSMSSYIKSLPDADKFVHNTLEAISFYNLDGIDFDIEDGACSSELQSYVIQRLKNLMPNIIISYTLPGTAENHEPYRSVIINSHSSIDFFNVMAYDVYWPGYNPIDNFDSISNLGVPKNKLVWGIMPGRHDAPNEFTSLQDAAVSAEYVLSHNMAGVMFWTFNRDTNHRTGGSGTIFETGMEDGSYLECVSEVLSRTI